MEAIISDGLCAWGISRSLEREEDLSRQAKKDNLRVVGRSTKRRKEEMIHPCGHFGPLVVVTWPKFD